MLVALINQIWDADRTKKEIQLTPADRNDDDVKMSNENSFHDTDKFSEMESRPYCYNDEEIYKCQCRCKCCNLKWKSQNPSGDSSRGETSLATLYLLFGTVFLCLISLAISLYTHVTNGSDGPKTLSDLLHSEEAKNELKSIVNSILKDKDININLQTDYYFRYESTKLPYISEPESVRNERKFTGGLERRYRRDLSLSSPISFAEPEVEFFNPKDRRELERQDAETIKRTGQRGAAPGGDDWVYLTTYCRVPEKVITGFCKATQEYCPPSPQGPPGLPGIPGPKGNRGDQGLPGPPGLDGREGKPGPRGPKGEPGFPGNSGLDGRDGVPGEPGLDGVPGRAGADGIPGRDGIDGRPGENGKNGMDGLTGPKGEDGPPGETGPRGLPGPRGRAGKPGINGTPGIPGINAWQFTSNKTSSELLIPPSIADATSPNVTRPVIVYEGKHLRLACAASGRPRPHVEWRRTDGRTIPEGVYQVSSLSGHYLNITNVHRDHMGGYECSADNGVPPVANATYFVEVHFSPLIRVPNQYIYSSVGSSATFECEIEAYPEALRFWERASNGRLLDPGEKYRMETHTNRYKTTMKLTITRISMDDYGEYFCVAKNELNTTTAIFFLKHKDHSSYMPFQDKNEVAVFGLQPPEDANYGQLCPDVVCEKCPPPLQRDQKCKDNTAFILELGGHVKATPTGDANYKGVKNRQMDCVLYAVGKPVYHKHTDQPYGAWLKDSLPSKNDPNGEKIWTTRENDTKLLEYSNKSNFRNNHPTKTHRLSPTYMGNAHVVYNGSFYYNAVNQPKVVRFDLNKLDYTIQDLPYAAANGSNYLYKTNYNYMDFNADENGLWVIHSTPGSNNTFVTKLESNTLEIEYSWNISVNHRHFGEMFIACGVLYAIDSITDKTTQIRLALDLYRNHLLDVAGLNFTNPFKKTTTVGYNFRTKELYSWDKGNQLTYPIRSHDIGYNTTSDERTEDGFNPLPPIGIALPSDE